MQTFDFGQTLIGIAEAKHGNTPFGLQLLKGSLDSPNLPEAKAWYGYCLAREKNDFRQGVALCQEAIRINPKSSDSHLALGRLYLYAGIRSSAIKTLQHGLSIDNNQDIYRLLKSIGIRKPPLFSFLARKSKLNVASGRLLSSIGLR